MALAKNLVKSHSTEWYYSLFNMHMCHYVNATCAAIPEAVAEVGPGTSLGAGLTALLAGARRLYALDTVKHADTGANTRTLHELVELIRTRRSPVNVDHFPSYRFVVGPGGFSSRVFPREVTDETLRPERIAEIEAAILGKEARSVSVEEVIPWQSSASDALEGQLDFIFSHSVMEHVDDIEDAYARMYRCLKPGGGISHSVDLKSHGYSKSFNGQLAIGREEWATRTQGEPYSINRRLNSEHIAAIRRVGFEIVFQTVRTRLDGVPRENLAEEFQGISDLDLMCGNLFIQAVRPA